MRERRRVGDPTECIVTIYCLDCGKKFELNVKKDDYSKWIDGYKVSKSFPYLTIDEKYLLLSNRCTKCRIKSDKKKRCKKCKNKE